MTSLDDASLFAARVPRAWAPLLARLADLDLLLAEGSGSDLDARRVRAAPIRADLLAGAAVLAGRSPPPLHSGSAEHARWFTEAALLWPHFADAGGRTLVDTHRSPTLARFRPDLVSGPAERAAIRAALADTFAFAPDVLARVEAEVAHRISNLSVKRAIAARLAQGLDAAPGSEGLAAQALRLFQRLYGPLPFRAGDVDVTLTTTSLVVGLPFSGTTFLGRDAGARPPAERAAIDAFLAEIERHKSSFDTLRFPGFGLYDRARVDPALVEELTAAAATEPGLGTVSAPVVAETLATMVTLVPSPDAELFLVHDIWGHGWEESLCDFEWSYARLVELREPVHAGSGPRFGGADTPPLVRAFAVAAGRVALDRPLFHRIVESDLRGRITVALNVVVSECLADLVEHQYVRRRSPGDPPLPSSSLYPDAPTKIDLGLRDVQTLLRAAHRSYRRLLTEPAEAARLEAELRAAGLPEAGLAGAVADAVHAVRTDFAHVLETRMTGGTPPPPETAGDDDDTVPANLAQRVMLSMVAVGAAVDRFLADADAAFAAAGTGDRWRCPAACIDLLVLLLGWFYEQDRGLYFWHLDELLRDELAPTLARFQRALGP
jgi:hypothetical protein